MENQVLDKTNYDRLKRILQFTFTMIDQKIELYKDTFSKEELDQEIDSSFYDEFDKALSCYKSSIGIERFTKLVEKHRLHADPQNINLVQEERDRQNAIARKIGGDMMNKIYTDIKEMCYKASPTEAKIQEVAEKVALIVDKQNEIIRKLSPAAAAQADGLKETTDVIKEKLKHTMFMIQQMRFVTVQTKMDVLEYFKKEEFLVGRDFDDEKVYNEVEFNNFLALVSEIAPNTVEFRSTLETFDYGPRPDFLKGNTTGKAKLVQTMEYKYYGEVSRSNPLLPHGKGIKLHNLTFILEEGWFVSGNRACRGRFVDNEFNLVYTGEYENGLMNGFGSLREALADRLYIGQFVRNMKEGYGECTYEDGSIYKGQWKNGRFNGQGMHLLPDGRTTSGNYIEDRRVGEQIITHPSGQKVMEIWDFGELKSRVPL